MVTNPQEGPALKKNKSMVYRIGNLFAASKSYIILCFCLPGPWGTKSSQDNISKGGGTQHFNLFFILQL